jgi:tetratricopeptide (TPR) repeat protein
VRFLLPSLLILTGCVTSDAARSTVDLEGLVARADRYFEARELGSALDAYELAAAGARSEGDDALFVEAAAQAAHLHLLGGSAPDGREWLRQAKATDARGDARSLTRVLLAEGAYARHDGQAARALALFEGLYSMCMRHELHGRAMQAAYMASLVTTAQAQIAWGERIVDAADAAGVPRWRAAAWGQLAWLLEGQARHADALDAFRRSRDLTRELGGARDLMKAEWAYGHGLRLAARPQEARAVLQRSLDASTALYSRVFSPNDAEWVARGHEELAELDAAARDYTGALRHLRAARKKFVEADAESLAPDVLEAVDRRLADLLALSRAAH